MDRKLWFKAKRYGWGWYPCTWQGWAVLLMFVFVLFVNTTYLNNHAHSNSDFLTQFFPQTYVLTVFLIIICAATGEKPRWRWGKDTEELVDVLNEQGEKTGQVVTRNETYRKGYWSAASDVFVVNSKKEFLMQLRSKQKLNNPNKWDISAGGRVDSGETPLAGAVREAHEELGLTLDTSELTYIGTVRESEMNEDRITNVFSSAYVVFKDVEIADLALQTSEVAKVEWVSLDELRQRISVQDPTLCSHPAEYVIFLEYVEEKYGITKN